MAVGLEEDLLADVLGVVVIAEPVVEEGVDVAQVRLVELGEGAIELLLVHLVLSCCRRPHGQPTSMSGGAPHDRDPLVRFDLVR